MLTQRSRYAIRALLALAKAPPGLPVPLRVIAEQARVPRKFLEIILS